MSQAWLETVRREYPNAIPWYQLKQTLATVLSGFGMTPENTLMASAVCRDEINQKGTQDLADYWGERFELAGLAGFPSAGVTGLGAYSSHVPEEGNLLIFYGPHVGVGYSGDLGKVERPGRSKEGGSCGSLLAFLGKCQKEAHYSPTLSDLDVEQYYVESSMLSAVPNILNDTNPVKALTHSAFVATNEKLDKLLEALGYTGPIALIGGITINTPTVTETIEDYFVPLRADILNHNNNKGEIVSWLDRF